MAVRNQRQIYVIFFFGIIFLSLILALVVWIPTPTIQQFFVFRVAIALSAAGIGALIPGIFDFRQEFIRHGSVRAGGAAAFFAVVWFTNPATLAIDGIRQPPAVDAEPIIKHFLDVSDSGRHEDAYSMFSRRDRVNMTLSSYLSMVSAIRAPLGARTAGPKLFHVASPQTINGMVGPYVIHDYQSRFAGASGIIVEEVGVIAEDGVWKISGYQIVRCEPPACTALSDI